MDATKSVTLILWRMYEAGSDRSYTAEVRDSALKQVMEGGRALAAVARSLEMSSKTLASWVYRARKGQALVKGSSRRHEGSPV